MRLRPFCIDFYERLAAIGSPLLSPSGVLVQPVDLYLAALMCSSDPLGPLPQMGGTLDAIAFRFRKWLYRFPLEYRNFQEYLKDHYATPNVWHEDDSKAQKINAPWTLSLESKMLEISSMSSAEIRSTSLSKIIWLSLAHAERHGGSGFVSDQEQQIIDKVNTLAGGSKNDV